MVDVCCLKELKETAARSVRWLGWLVLGLSAQPFGSPAPASPAERLAYIRCRTRPSLSLLPPVARGG